MRRGALARARGAFFPRSGAGEASVYLACWRGGGPKRPALRWCSGWGRTQALAQARAQLEAAAATQHSAQIVDPSVLAALQQERETLIAAVERGKAQGRRLQAAFAAAQTARNKAESDAARNNGALNELRQRVADLAAHQQTLERQLAERNDAVAALEQALSARQLAEESRTLANARILENAHAQHQSTEDIAAQAALRDELERARRRSAELEGQVIRLDERLEGQKDLLRSLEQELTSAQQREFDLIRRMDAEIARRDREIRALSMRAERLPAA